MKNYYILKTFCRKMFLVGSGNFWYENGEIGDDSRAFYRILTIFLFLAYCFMTLLEIMAAFIGDFPEDQKSDSITFSVSHTIVMIKIFSIIKNKKLVKKLMFDMVRICELHERDSLMVEKYRIMKINVIAYFVTVYSSAACFVFEGLRKVYNGNINDTFLLFCLIFIDCILTCFNILGSHFVTIVTYYPAFADDSVMANLTRVFTTLILFMMLISMIITVDGFTMVNLIMFKYKFITLRHYFEELRDEVDRICETGNSEMAAEKLRNGLVEGIVMHKELLRVGKEIDKVFGTVMACQLCQSSGSAVSLLLQIALSKDLTFVASLKIIFFVTALFFLLGLFLCNAGEITYQASLLSDSIFYCGWYLFPPHLPRGCHLRKIVCIACAQAQRPLIMKAFKMLELTYATFLLVVRGTYSVFALFNARQEK